MCLAIPMQVVAVDGFTARCAAKGVERDVSLFLMQEDPVAVGDYVMVHVGYAIQKVAEADALYSWELFDEILKEGDQGLGAGG
ncbi:MAG: HypC/HybG/HupF family hydrogenase formation chaperone [Nitrospirota bacterium]|jgi:hydrogenase expression/formation protein HypC